MHFKLTLTYDGTSFHGWQVQPHRPTVQGTLSHALHHLTGETVLPQGSGRTDAGVHALAQVATFSLSTNIPPENLLRALNRALPPSIRILSAAHVPASFHARYSALRKTYEYRIFTTKEIHSPNREPHLSPSKPGSPGDPEEATAQVPRGFSLGSHSVEKNSGFSPQGMLSSPGSHICPPFLAPYVWDCPWPLDPTPMQLAAKLLEGTHDFTSFAAADPDQSQRETAKRDKSVILNAAKDLLSSAPATIGYPEALASALISPNTRTLHLSQLTLEHNLLLYRVTGSGFLHHMVRNIAGTLVDIGRGALTPNDIPRILASRNRSSAGPTAPPQGLFLLQVDYPEEEPEAQSCP